MVLPPQGLSLGAQTDTGQAAPPAPPSMGVRGPILAGAAVMIGFFVILCGWAVLAPLSSAAVAPGSVIVEGNRKTIQHLEGGIVRKILVRDGDRVKAGEPLILLDDTQAKASLDLVRGRLTDALALSARLLAERDGSDAISFPDELLDGSADMHVLEAMNGQAGIFAARRESLDGQIAILHGSKEQFGEEISGLRGLVKAEQTQLALIDEEIRDIRSLIAKGLARKPRILELRRAQAEIDGSRSQHLAEIGRVKQRIVESELRISELKTERLNEVVAELRTVQAETYDLYERERAAADILTRTKILAPLSGTVISLQAHTSGGVIAPGAPVLEIVPEGERLVVDARIDPSDIDVVDVGLRAQVRFSAFNQRTTIPVDGTLTWVSADVLVDQQSGQSFYRSRIELDDGFEANLAGNSISPGMQVEVMILTGERTVMDYIIAPLFNSINRGFREN